MTQEIFDVEEYSAVLDYMIKKIKIFDKVREELKSIIQNRFEYLINAKNKLIDFEKRHFDDLSEIYPEFSGYPFGMCFLGNAINEINAEISKIDIDSRCFNIDGCFNFFEDYTIKSTVSETGPLNFKEISREIGINPIKVSAILNKLQHLKIYEKKKIRSTNCYSYVLLKY